MQDRNDRVAGAHTPLVYNAWYVAATSKEIGENLMSRWLLEQSVLLYRTDEGRPVALDNRCPHRSFPLSQGRRIGNNVACGYHGMTFAPDGRCVQVPAIGRTAGNLRTRAYPVVERAPLIWVWLGDPSLADEALIPDHLPLTESGWAMVSGYYYIQANYVGLHENLQDLSHFEHLHRSSIGAPDQSVADIAVDQREEGIFSKRTYANVLAPPLWKDILELKSDRITRTIEEAFRSPALCEALTTITDETSEAAERRSHRLRILHFITPESQHRTHYFWFFGRDFAIDDAEIGEKLRQGVATAFLEDKQALESIAELVSKDSRTDFKELSFASDKSGILLRRCLGQLAHAERSATNAVASPGNVASR